MAKDLEFQKVRILPLILLPAHHILSSPSRAIPRFPASDLLLLPGSFRRRMGDRAAKEIRKEKK